MEIKPNQAALILDIGEDGSITVYHCWKYGCSKGKSSGWSLIPSWSFTTNHQGLGHDISFHTR